MGGSIPGCTLEKNRWFGKALFTASHEWIVGRSKDRPNAARAFGSSYGFDVRRNITVEQNSG
jgi:hypothetical protein